MTHDWENILRLIPGYDPYRDAAGCTFDETEANRVIRFFQECQHHIEGALAGTPFLLEPWQKSILGNLFGWRRANGTRRYRECLIYVPRKNGKTPLAAAVANFVMFCDDEKGQQNICAAADSDQATLVFRHAKGMVESEAVLQQHAKIYTGMQRCIETPNGFFRVISSIADTKHGGNLHLAIIDELHVQPNRELVDVIQTSMASQNRRQPLLVYITTADFARESICNEKHDYARKVRDGIIADPAFLPVIYEATLDDDWTSPEVWARANPNLGVSVSLDYLERECLRAKESPAYQNTFKRLHLNIVTEQEVRWLDMAAWDACDELVADAELTGLPCWAGLDLAKTNDICALVLVYKLDEGRFCLRPWFWAPRDMARRRDRSNKTTYVAWAQQGLIELTDGDVTDYGYIRKRINELRTAGHDIREIVFDPWNAAHFAQLLHDEDGFETLEFRQTISQFAGPTKEMEGLVRERRICHGGNPVLRWMASNVTVKTDPSGNIRPVKPEAKNANKIDGIVASIMGLSRALGAINPNSVYESRGLLRV